MRVYPLVLSLASVLACNPSAEETAAAASPERGPRTQPGTAMGLYAPDQHPLYDGRFVLSASDIYQVGAVAYYMLTGEPMFTGKDAEDVFAKHAWVEPRYPSALVDRRFARDLEAAIMQCVLKDPDERPNGMRALIDMLDSLEEAHAWDGRRAREWWEAHPDATEM